MGWQFPQLLIANQSSKKNSLQTHGIIDDLSTNGVPFLGLAIVAWFYGIPGSKTGTLYHIFVVNWQGLGAGLTANAWQALIAKIIPPHYRARYSVQQASAPNILASISAISPVSSSIGSHILVISHYAFALFCYGNSFIFLSQVHEEEKPPTADIYKGRDFWNNLYVC